MISQPSASWLRLRLGLVCLILSFNPAMAQTATAVPLVVNPEDCRQFINHSPDGAAYEPGKDVNGNAVTPAEGPATPGTMGSEDLAVLANKTTLYLGLDVAKRYGLTGKNQALSGDLALGVVTFENGQVMINSKPLATGDDPAVVAACKQALKGR